MDAYGEMLSAAEELDVAKALRFRCARGRVFIEKTLAGYRVIGHESATGTTFIGSHCLSLSLAVDTALFLLFCCLSQDGMP